MENLDGPREPLLLASFLQDQFEEGVCDSRGRFTVDIEKAQRKLGAFQLPTRESWLLVLVQAAHRGGAREVRIEQFARESLIRVIGARRWCWADLESVLQGSTTTDGALLGYATVFRALQSRTDLTNFRMKAPDGTSAAWSQEVLLLSQGRIEDTIYAGETVLEISHLGELPEKVPLFFEAHRSAQRELSALRSMLTSSCFPCGVQVIINGRKLDPLPREQLLPAGHHLHLLGLVTASAFQIPPLGWDTAIHNVARLEGESSEISLLLGVCIVEERKFRLFRANRRILSDSTRSRLLWIQDGAVVGREPLPISGTLELTLILSGAGLQTDLSGLELVNSEERERRRTLGLEVAALRLQELAAQNQEQRVPLWSSSQRIAGASSPESWPHSLLDTAMGRHPFPDLQSELEAVCEQMRALSATSGGG